MREITFGEAIVEAMYEEMKRDDRVFLMGEDVGPFGMIYIANPRLWKEFGDERVRDTPISENAIIGYALGAAVMGMRPGQRQTSVLVPPMSKVTRSPRPVRRATWRPAAMPPAGPDSTAPAARRADSRIGATPPCDCMISTSFV